MSATRKMKPQTRGAIKVLLAAVVWSTSGLLGKWMPWDAFSLVGVRALVSVLVLGIYRKRFSAPMNKGTWIGAVGVSATSVLFLTANKLTSAANAIVLQYAMPVFVIIGCAVWLKQRPRLLDIVTCVIVLFGVALCFLDKLGSGSVLGDVLALLSAVSFAIVFFAARLPGVNPFDYSYLGNLISCVFLLFIPFDPAVTFQVEHTAVAVLMGLFLVGGYMLFSAGMRDGVSPLSAAIVSNVEPVLNPTWVFLAMGEFPGSLSIVGAVIVLGTATFYTVAGTRRQ